MIVQGLKLTMLGMMVVFLFLFLLLMIIQLSAKLLKKYTKKEISLTIAHTPSGVSKVQFPDENLKLTAVISAAIAAHRARKGRYTLP
ncbi:MAG: OadG family protein [Desulfobacula sp.]|nr:OadG family protein [Desulfobacula sp.]